MERLQRISRFWNWLPAFRAVAETQHLPKASEGLHLSPPALSRAVRLLEQDMGVPLFRRVGRRIELSEAGEKFLPYLRDAMRLIHDGLLALEGRKLQGRVVIGSGGVLTTAHLLPALETLQEKYPDFVPILLSFQASSIVSALLAGRIDAAFLSEEVHDDRIERIPLGHAPCSLWVGRGHPFFGKSPSLDQVLTQPFVAPPPPDTGGMDEGWPPDLPRKVGVHVDQMRIGLDFCLKGRFIAVLPNEVARPHAEGDRLWRLPLDLVPDVPLFAYTRKRLRGESMADLLVEAVQRQVDGEDRC